MRLSYFFSAGGTMIVVLPPGLPGSPFSPFSPLMPGAPGEPGAPGSPFSPFGPGTGTGTTDGAGAGSVLAGGDGGTTTVSFFSHPLNVIATSAKPNTARYLMSGPFLG